jgi:hypothetical protein
VFAKTRERNMDFIKLLEKNAIYLIFGLAFLFIVVLVLYIINLVQINTLKKRYSIFMEGNDAKSLESRMEKRFQQVDYLLEEEKKDHHNIDLLFKNMEPTFKKFGLVKYDAFHEMGGKLSFSLCLLSEVNDGFIINAVHSREGCYTYVKEILNGNSYLVLAEEEKDALNEALNSKKEKK